MYAVPAEKRCSRCGERKPAEDFSASSSSRDGLASRCRSCHRLDVAEYRERVRARNRERGPRRDGVKRCSACDRVRARTDFAANASGTDGLQWRCRRCAAKDERRAGRSRRRCSKCRRELARSAFHRDRRSRDGLQAWCKGCLAQANRRARERNRRRNAERTPDLDATKRCSRCRQDRPGREFHRNRTTADGLHWTCRECSTTVKGTEEERRRYERLRLLRSYGIEREELERMLERQGGACAICRQPFNGVPRIDHDHATDHVRGLLCNNCNAGLGMFKDDPQRLRRAISYLADADRYARELPGP